MSTVIRAVPRLERGADFVGPTVCSECGIRHLSFDLHRKCALNYGKKFSCGGVIVSQKEYQRRNATDSKSR